MCTLESATMISIFLNEIMRVAPSRTGLKCTQMTPFGAEFPNRGSYWFILCMRRLKLTYTEYYIRSHKLGCIRVWTTPHRCQMLTATPGCLFVSPALISSHELHSHWVYRTSESSVSKLPRNEEFSEETEGLFRVNWTLYHKRTALLGE